MKFLYLPILVIVAFLLSPVVVSAMVVPSFAAATQICGNGDDTSKGQILQGAGQTGTDCTGAGVSNAVKTAIEILSTVVGVVAVIVVVISGLKYITSGGDSNGVSNAKNTLTYALVGLAVAALAQILVNFVLFQVAPHPCPYDSKIDTASSLCVPPAKKK